jgi:uncharacterized protein (TIGR03083 family)
MHVDHDAGRSGFLDALSRLLQVSDDLDDEALLAASHCRGWTAGDVLVHVHLGLQEMLLGVVSPTAQPPDTDAADYWRHEVPTNDPEADSVAGVRFVRALGAAYRRPVGAVAHLRTTADGVTRAVAAMTPGTVAFQGRVLATGDFLATWAVELTVHHLDLSREIDLAPPAPEGLRLARATIESLLVGALPRTWSDEVAVLIGAGRVEPDDSQAEGIGAVLGRLPVLG